MPLLYEIPKGSKMMVTYQTADMKESVRGAATFHHIDGIYSLCTLDDVEEPNNIFHLSVSTSVNKNDEGYYEIEV